MIDTSLRMLPEVITGVGFCMYVTKRALDLCGLLDEETFGKGYGEEVDFCLRATRLGLRHVVDDSTFVYHRGGGSFGDQQSEGLARGSRLLDERYPYFRPTNLRERAAGPVADLVRGARARVCTNAIPARAHVLHIMHSAPGDTGGTEKFLDSLMSSLRDEFDFSVFYPVAVGLRAADAVGARRRLHLGRSILPPRRPAPCHADHGRGRGRGAGDGARHVLVRRRARAQPHRPFARRARCPRGIRRPGPVFRARPLPRRARTSRCSTARSSPAASPTTSRRATVASRWSRKRRCPALR